MSADIRRPRYYQQQYLGAADLEAEQDYHRDMRRRHNLAHHTWGCVIGLEVEADGDSRLTVAPGMAVDGFGREILVLAPTELGPDDFQAARLGTGRQPIWLAYHEDGAEDARYGYAECTDGEVRRVVETYRLHVGQPLDPDGHDDLLVAGEAFDSDASWPYQELPEEDLKARWLVRLADVFWDSTTDTFGAIDSDERPWVGAVAQALWAPAGQLRLVDRRETPDLTVAVEGVTHAKGDVQLHGTKLLPRNSDGLGEDVAIGRSDPGALGGVDLRMEIGPNPSGATPNRFVVVAGTSDLFTVREDGTATFNGPITVADGNALTIDGGALAIGQLGSSPPQWSLGLGDPLSGSPLQLRETIAEGAGSERVVLEVLEGSGNDTDPVLRFHGADPAELNTGQVRDLTEGGTNTPVTQLRASTSRAGLVEIATSSQVDSTGPTGAPLVVRASDSRLLTPTQKTDLTDGGQTALHSHTVTFIDDTEQVWLFADSAGSAVDTFEVDLGSQRHVLATTSIVATEATSFIFGDDVDAYVEVEMQDGIRLPQLPTPSRFGFGTAAALRPPSWRGFAQTITFRLRAFEGRAWALCLVFHENP